MEKIVIYGTGSYCKKILSEKRLSQYEIIGSMDSDPGKWNGYAGDYRIMRPDELKALSYDKIVITAIAYEDIAYKLVKELSVPTDKILFISVKDGKIHEIPGNSAWFRDIEKKKAEKAVFQKMACKVLQESLLIECLENGEFEGYHEIVVVGEEEQLQIVRGFFSCIDKGMKVCPENQDDSVSEKKKYILTSSTYQEELQRLLEEKKCTRKQCLIIPLFDVEGTVAI